jgi:sugar transferase EpsL
LDICLVGASAPLWLPMLGALALVVRWRLGRPVFFRQERIGLNDKSFTMIKFRTMRDAASVDGVLLPDAERLTPFGHTLRASSLDELPELLNVLRGDMSLVGPRPLLPRYLPRYSAVHRRRHLVRPGLTGLAQVSGRNAMSWQEKLDFDVEYEERCSLSLDLLILFRTVRAVAKREGISANNDATMPEFMGY